MVADLSAGTQWTSFSSHSLPLDHRVALSAEAHASVLLIPVQYDSIFCVVSCQVIRKMGHYLKMNLNVPEDYVEGFVRANNTFLYQLVFDPVRREVVPLNPYPDHLDIKTLSYAGLYPPQPLSQSLRKFT